MTSPVSGILYFALLFSRVPISDRAVCSFPSNIRIVYSQTSWESDDTSLPTTTTTTVKQLVAIYWSLVLVASRILDGIHT